MGFAWRGADEDTEKTRILEQIYNINLAGKVWNPRFGIFSAGVTYRDRSLTGDIEEDSENLGYNLTTSLFRAFVPFTLFARRETLNVGGDLTQSSTVTDTTYGVNLLLPFRKLPSLSLRYEDFTSETDNPNLEIRKIQERLLNIGLSKNFGDHSVTLNYNFRDVVKDISGNSFTENQISTSIGTRPFSHLFINATGLLNTKEGEEFLNTGLGLTYTPSPKLNMNVNYFFFQSDRELSATQRPFQSQLQLLNYGVRFRPTENWQTQIDYTFSGGENSNITTNTHTGRIGQIINFLGFDLDMGYFYTTTGSLDFKSTTQGIRGRLSKELVKGFTVALRSSLFLGDSTSSDRAIRSQTLDYGGELRYLVPFQGFNAEASYSLIFREIDEAGGSDNGLNQILGLNLTSTAFEKIQLSSDYQFVQETASSLGNRFLSHFYTFGVHTTPWENFILRTTLDLNLSEEEDEESIVTRKGLGFSGNLNYQWRQNASLELFADYSTNPITVVERFTDIEESDIIQRFFYGANLNLILRRNLSFSIPVRREINTRESGKETIFRATPLLTYRLGRFFFLLEGQFRSVDQPGRAFQEYGILFRIRRPFIIDF